jgi:hypothetical protein
MTRVPSLASALRDCARSGRRELLTSDLALRGGAQGACTWGAVDGHAALELRAAQRIRRVALRAA